MINYINMIPIQLLKKIKLHNFSNIADAVTALVTAAIVSMDLGVNYTKSEKAFYTHPIFQIIIVLCIAYEMLGNLSISTIVLLIWLIIKYLHFFRPDLNIKNNKEKN